MEDRTRRRGRESPRLDVSVLEGILAQLQVSYPKLLRVRGGSYSLCQHIAANSIQSWFRKHYFASLEPHQLRRVALTQVFLINHAEEDVETDTVRMRCLMDAGAKSRQRAAMIFERLLWLRRSTDRHLAFMLVMERRSPPMLALIESTEAMNGEVGVASWSIYLYQLMLERQPGSVLQDTAARIYHWRLISTPTPELGDLHSFVERGLAIIRPLVNLDYWQEVLAERTCEAAGDGHNTVFSKSGGISVSVRGRGVETLSRWGGVWLGANR